MWLFVDFDGTLVDSLNTARMVYDRFVTECGAQPDDEEFRDLNGPSLSEIVDRIVIRCGLTSDRPQLLARYTTIWAGAYDTVLPRRGSTELLRGAQARGVRTAIVTSASAGFVSPVVHRLGWDDMVEHTISGDLVARSKPDPAIYELALARTGAQPAAVLALEDSSNGVRAAAAAGISVVGLAEGGAWGHTSQQLRSAGATRVISGLGEFFAGDRR